MNPAVHRRVHLQHFLGSARALVRPRPQRRPAKNRYIMNAFVLREDWRRDWAVRLCEPDWPGFLPPGTTMIAVSEVKTRTSAAASVAADAADQLAEAISDLPR